MSQDRELFRFYLLELIHHEFIRRGNMLFFLRYITHKLVMRLQRVSYVSLSVFINYFQANTNLATI